MKGLEATFLDSRVALKMFAVVSLGALLPILGLGLVTLSSVSGHLEDRGIERLSAASREVANSMLERMRISVERIEAGTYAREVQQEVRISALQEDILERGEFVVTQVDGRLVVGLPGEDSAPPEWHWLDEPFLFWGTLADPTATDNRLDIFLPDGRPLIEHDRPLMLTQQRTHRIQQAEIDGQTWWGASYSLPVQSGSLRIVVSEPVAELLAPARNFRKRFPLVVATSLVLALLTTVILVRKVLTPLEQLRDATESLAEQKFDTRVEIKSGDEFEELAESFNQMTRHLGQQFQTLNRINDLGRIALKKFTPEEIIESVLDQIDSAMISRWNSFLLFEDEETSALCYSRVHNDRAEIATSLRCLDGNEFRIPEALKDQSVFFDASESWQWLAPDNSQALSLAVLPIQVDGRLGAIIAIGLDDELGVLVTSAQPQGSRETEFRLVRMVADQVGVALANASLVGGLERLTLGTLLALARAVDAKSPWTRGHSERVARAGRLIAEAMGYDDTSLDTLYRGGLLHDIGKIGIPASILDKEGPLTEDEREIMRSHPELGVMILEPIPGFEDVLPIVEQHHERIDGLGYPHGLKGDEILMEARIFAVADVFDALASNRPYRPGMEIERVLEIMDEGSGTQFDAEVLAAFHSILPEIQREILSTDYQIPVKMPIHVEPRVPHEPIQGARAAEADAAREMALESRGIVLVR